MGCEHKQIKSVNCELFCLVCGAKLPNDFITGKEEAPQEAKKPAKTAKKRGVKNG